MKRLLFVIASFLMLATITEAQRASVFPTIAGDTVITSATRDTVTKIISVSAGYSHLAIQVNATKVSGTVTCKAYIYQSLDGVNYAITDSSTAFADAAGTQIYQISKVPPPYGYYKVQVRNVGLTASTESVAIKVYYVLRKYSN